MDHLIYQLIKLLLVYLPVSIPVQLCEYFLDVLLGGMLHMEGVSQFVKDEAEFMKFDGAGIVGVEDSEGVLEGFFCNA